MPIRVLITDDHAVLRAGLRLLINAQSDMEVIGEAGTIPEAITTIQAVGPDVVLMDLAMAGRIDMAAITQTREACPTTRVLILTMHTEAGYVRAALAAGAVGYVTKSAADTELLTAIRAAAQGRTFVDFAATAEAGPDLLFGSPKLRQPGGSPGWLSLLSQREREVFSLVAQGFTNRQIADQLGVSVKSVEAYRSRLMEKLGLRSRVALVQYAVDCGILKPGRATP